MLLKEKKEIDTWLKQYIIKNYELIEDQEYSYIVNVNGDVNLQNQKLENIKVKFNEIKGNFVCNDNKLISLEGCPEIVNGDFSCAYNKIKSLRYSPKIVKSFYAQSNCLETLEYCPKIVQNINVSLNYIKSLLHFLKIVNGKCCLNYNEIKSLEGVPEIIQGGFYCSHNKLKSLEHCPKIVNGDLVLDYNLLTIEHLVFISKKIEKNIYLYGNKELDDLQFIESFEELKEKIMPLLEKFELIKINIKKQGKVNKL